MAEFYFGCILLFKVNGGGIYCSEVEHFESLLIGQSPYDVKVIGDCVNSRDW